MLVEKRREAVVWKEGGFGIVVFMSAGYCLWMGKETDDGQIDRQTDRQSGTERSSPFISCLIRFTLLDCLKVASSIWGMDRVIG